MKSKAFAQAALLLVSALLVCTGCGAETALPEPSQESVETGAQSTQAETPASPIPDADYGGHTFRILQQIKALGTFSEEHFYIEKETGEVLNDAIYRRNRAIEEKLNIRITEDSSANYSVSEMIKKAVSANDDAWDIALYSNPMEMNLSNMYYMDFYALDTIQFDNPWWDSNYAAANSVGGYLYSAVNSMMLTPYDNILVMLFNKRLAETYDLPDLYQAVRDGVWTLEFFYSITRGITDDIDGNGKLDDNDRYVFVGLDGIDRLCSAKLTPIIKDKDDIPTLNINDTTFLSRLETIRGWGERLGDDIYDPRTDLNTGSDGDSAVFRLFRNGQVVFYAHGLGSVRQFRDMEADFGVLPTMKLDEAQDAYWCEQSNTYKCIVIPSCAPAPERTAHILDALAWESYVNLRPAYYETMLQNKLLRDEESVEMLDTYIISKVNYVYRYSTLYGLLTKMKNGTAEIQSGFAKSSGSIERELEKYIANQTET